MVSFAPAVARPSASAVRCQVPVTATSDATGSATFTFPDAPEGQWQVGTITIAAAPANAQFGATNALQPWSVWNGAAPSSVIQVDPRSHVAVAADFLTPSTIYVAWFIGWSDVYDALIYPTEAVTPTQQSVTLLSQSQIVTSSALVPISGTVTPWLQTLAIRLVKTAGTSNGVQVTVTDPTLPITDVLGRTVAAYGQWIYVPVGGRPCSIQIAPLVNGANTANPITMTVEVDGIAQVLAPPVTSLGEGPGGFLGLTVDTAIAAGVTAALFATPPTGLIARVRGITVAATIAPVAGAFWIARGNISAAAYRRFGPSTAIVASFGTDSAFYVGAGTAGVDNVEGLNGVNNTTVNSVWTVNYDLVPNTLGQSI
jgi:hypothetical protein